MWKRKSLSSSAPRAEFRISYGATSNLEWWSVSRRTRDGYWDFIASYESPEKAEAALMKLNDVRYYDKDGSRLLCGTS